MACVGERDQVSSQVPAVDRGHILRIERTQVTCIVPIEEVAAVLRQPSHGRERRLQPLHGLEGPDPSEVPRARYRQQIEADIGRRCAMGYHRLRSFLEIVRRQHVVGRRDRMLRRSATSSGRPGANHARRPRPADGGPRPEATGSPKGRRPERRTRRPRTRRPRATFVVPRTKPRPMATAPMTNAPDIRR